jgi:ribosomal protein S18 acetylase RimI-like enzyme
MNIRRLSESDAPQFQALRLAALVDKPEAFVTSHVEEKDLPLAAFEEKLAGCPGGAVFGAFDGDTLVGIAGLARETLLQTRHKGRIWGMYVAAAARGRGVARALLDSLLAYARTTPDMAKVTLSVDSANIAAIALYESLGFVVFAREVDAVRLDGQSRDDLQMHLRFAAP